ncbi:hypothetical protein MKY14_30280 [Paenibacillus sp. FSL R5-0887]|jgi:hypothetical protein|uniref:hypothetical protein n=1 Tax=Paenibacillus TaxID=44249 RepID=UPI00096C2494|nr:hypothetical protein [Paenibacillus odorifer]OMD60671.1 hypothetical protein BSK62_25260 [Paenibacillus odorifer]OMD89451.1 hypothetical protein BSK67_24725 [Paenibacillus odorifer]
MSEINVAYTNEYQEHKKKFEYIFNKKFMSKDINERLLPDGKHILKTYYYYDDSHQVSEYNVRASKTDVLDLRGNIITELKNIDYHVDFFSMVEHSNGKNYLLFSTELYGYSVLDLSDLSTHHFIPAESFKEHKETFIWTSVLYCAQNNILAVDGCYWACPSSTFFFDFSQPTKIPLKEIYNSYDMDGEVNIDTDVIPLRWNNDGTIVLKCCMDEEGVKEVEKTIDVLSRKK